MADGCGHSTHGRPVNPRALIDSAPHLEYYPAMTDPDFLINGAGEPQTVPDPEIPRERRRKEWRQKRTADRQSIALPAIRREPGRPSTYSQERAVAVYERIIERGSVRKACQDPDMPSEHTLYKWAVREAEFSQLFTRAREIAMHRVAEDLLEIADDPSLDPLDKRVRVDTRRWLMGKLAARQYGDKITVAGDPTAPLGLDGGVLDLSRLSDHELDLLEQFAEARIAALDAAAGKDSG
jgi:hypothetical protein